MLTLLQVCVQLFFANNNNNNNKYIAINTVEHTPAISLAHAHRPLFQLDCIFVCVCDTFAHLQL